MFIFTNANTHKHIQLNKQRHSNDSHKQAINHTLYIRWHRKNDIKCHAENTHKHTCRQSLTWTQKQKYIDTHNITQNDKYTMSHKMTNTQNHTHNDKNT